MSTALCNKCFCIAPRRSLSTCTTGTCENRFCKRTADKDGDNCGWLCGVCEHEFCNDCVFGCERCLLQFCKECRFVRGEQYCNECYSIMLRQADSKYLSDDEEKARDELVEERQQLKDKKRRLKRGLEEVSDEIRRVKKTLNSEYHVPESDTEPSE
jgi:hypothetical protein